jgi:hypothetical protein
MSERERCWFLEDLQKSIELMNEKASTKNSSPKSASHNKHRQSVKNDFSGNVFFRSKDIEKHKNLPGEDVQASPKVDTVSSNPNKKTREQHDREIDEFRRNLLRERDERFSFFLVLR